MMTNISEKLKEMRKARGLSLHQAARRADTSPATFFRYENGWNRFEVYTLRKIASALGYRMRITFDPIASPPGPRSPIAAVSRLKRLFWDRPLKIEFLRTYPAWVTERVLDFGSMDDVHTLVQFFGRRKFLEIVAGIYFKSPRTRVLWQSILRKEHIQCTQNAFRQAVVNSWPE